MFFKISSPEISGCFDPLFIRKPKSNAINNKKSYKISCRIYELILIIKYNKIFIIKKISYSEFKDK